MIEGVKLYEIEYEKEDILFKEMVKLTLEEVMYFFKSILLMLNKLTLKFGFFLLTDKMIGFSERKCKLWINEIFTSNLVMLTAES